MARNRKKQIKGDRFTHEPKHYYPHRKNERNNPEVKNPIIAFFLKVWIFLVVIFWIGVFIFAIYFGISVFSDINMSLNPDLYKTTGTIVKNFHYIDNMGQERTIEFVTYKGVYERLTGWTVQGFHRDGVHLLLDDKEQDAQLSSIIEQIKQTSPDPEIQAKNAIRFVTQSIEYDTENYLERDLSVKYPYATVYTGKGVCIDKTILTVYILNRLGFGTVVFSSPTHAACGIQCSSDISDYCNSVGCYCYVDTTAKGLSKGKTTIIHMLVSDVTPGRRILSSR